METTIEYRVRPVTRYIVTRFVDSGDTGSCEERGEFDNGEMAYAVGYALAAEEARRLGLPPGDDRVKFPEHPLEFATPLTEGD